ncbi:response regulator transcription factor [Tistrella mobilis]|uniref:Two-component system response regulator n=2 Tax=Tistrella mobilis TaxID=171437 RepID=A0A162L9J9_9PROT|nr:MULTISPECIES: response regulator transcription factor [Tistrella]KYO53936.1 two-component system response regulator [Tistrella mobilis]MAD40202.1 DNA-binding response regulator [Tistrella sp.]
MSGPRILMIDDDAELGAMLTEYLAGEGFDTTLVTTGDAGLEAALGGGYAAVLLDIMLPRIGGLDVLRRLRAASRVPVIMLTARGDDVDRVVGLELGADDYVPKPCYPRELVARLRAVLRRSEAAALVAPASIEAGPIRLETEARRVIVAGEIVDLTATEFNLLERLIRAGNRVVAKDELSREVLGRPHETYDRSIDVHMSHLRRKLVERGVDETVLETVRGVGYRVNRA